MNLIEQKLLPSAIFADSRNSERREIVSRVPKLSEVVVKATFAPNRHIDPSIKKIDLGSLVYEAQLLRDFTANDPRHREAGKHILITNDKYPLIGQPKVVIEREPRIGDESTILPSLFKLKGISGVEDRRSLSKPERQNKFNVTTLHTHPNEMPPSPDDIGHILLDDIEYISASTCAFVATPEFNYLVYRGARTPSLNLREIHMLKEAWETEIEKKLVSKFADDDIARGKFIRLSAGDKYKSDPEWIGIQAIVRKEVLNEVIRGFGLTVFCGRKDSRIVSRAVVSSALGRGE